MSVEVVMPQMGESIAEGTISKWLKQVGEKVEKDESLLEISTDKVDAEVPSPSAGILLEIRAGEGETVEVNSVVGILGEEGAEPVQSARSNVPSQVETPKVDEVEFKTIEAEQTELVEQAQAATANSINSVNSENSINSANSTEVVMPPMGESITEGTVSKWLKAVGDKIEKDESLLEISTDKVDAEVPSPIAGTLLEIRTKEGETVEVGSVVGLVGAEGASLVQNPTSNVQSQTSAAGQNQAEQATAQATSADISASKMVSMPAEEKEEVEEVEGRSYDYDRPNAVEDTTGNGQSVTGNGQMSVEDLRRTKSSPLVRNIAKEHGVDISRIEGSGMSGRVTKKDIISFIESGAALRPQDLLVKSPARLESQEPKTRFSQDSRLKTSVSDKVEPMSVMRRKIAEHMTFSKQTSAHVTSVYEFDMTNVAKFRDKNKAEFQARYGTKLSYMPFIFQAVTQTLRQFPIVNSQVSGDQIIYKGDVNLGMAVALDWGLIVPVIKRANQLSLSGLALAANDLADRARKKKLNPDEVQGGTFTITNPGVFGGLFGTPIINQPQVAILCVGTIEKRPKVMTTDDGDDVIAIRSMAYFALTYDHRIVDGADAERLLSFMKEYLETTQFSL
ncbi:2-oxoglutarate dehydrogenase, E2 component, dihydrolipoamide succinyltransferase [soil metagenome]